MKENNITAIDYNPFEGIEIAYTLPTTEPQKEIWLACLFGDTDANKAYNESINLTLSGSVNIENLTTACNTVMQRHDVLRSAFDATGETMIIFRIPTAKINYYNLQQQSFNEQKNFITNLDFDDANERYNLLNGPLCRWNIVQLDDSKTILKFSAHHIICDGWSLGIILQEISNIYNALTANSSMPETPIPWHKYVAAQLQYYKSEERILTQQYWISKLSKGVNPLIFTTDNEREIERTYNSNRIDIPFPDMLAAAIKNIAAKNGVSFITAIISLFEIAAFAISKQKNITIGIPTAGQSISNNEQLVGHCVHLLPIISEYKAASTFETYLRVRKKELLNDYEHQQVSFGSILKELKITRTDTYVPLIPVVFNVDMGLDNGVVFNGLTHSLLYAPRSFENFELFVNVSGNNTNLTFEWSYNSYLFSASTIEKMMNQLVTIAEHIVANPSINLDIFININNKVVDTPKAEISTTSTSPNNTFSSLQLIIADVWKELLVVSTIHSNDNFFDLGGHSLIAAQLMRKLEKKLDKKVPLSTIFKHPIFKDFAAQFTDEPLKKITLTNTADSDINNKENTVSIAATNAQKEIWVAVMLGEAAASRSYNLTLSLVFNGNFEKELFEEAIKIVYERHQSFKATFSKDGNDIIIKKQQAISYNYNDVSALDAKFCATYLQNKYTEYNNYIFNLQNGPLAIFNLLKITNHQYQFTIQAHHIICDGWSLNTIINELCICYNTLCKKEKIQLQKPALFTEYCQKNSIKTSNNNTKHYWLEKLGDSIPIVQIPSEKIRPEKRTYDSKRKVFDIDIALMQSAFAFGNQVGTTISITTRAIFELFLYQITKQTELIIGMPVAQQQFEENTNLVGQCVNLIPIKSSWYKNETVIEYINRRKLEILNDYEHQQITFSELINQLPIDRDASRIPLISIVLNIEIADAIPTFSGLNTELIFHEKHFETFELYVNTAGTVENPKLQWTYNTNLFTASEIDVMMEQFLHTFHTVISSPSTPITTLFGNVNKLAIHKQLGIFNTTEVFPLHQSLSEVFYQYAATFSNKNILTYNNTKLSFEQLNHKSNQVANYLQTLGVSTNSKVVLAVNRDEKLIIILWAIIKLGATYIPIDPTYPQERIAYVITDSNANLVITNAEFRNKFSEGKIITVEECWPIVNTLTNNNIANTAKSDSVLYILYTSGSTGKPKGVQVLHSNVINLAFSMQKILALNFNDSILGVTTISFDISGGDIFLPIITGANLTIVDSATAKDGYLLLDAIKLYKPTFMQVTPATWQMLLDIGWNSTDSIKTIASSGEALTTSLAKRLLPNCSNLYNLYGPTETTIWSLFEKVTLGNIENITIGNPISNTQVLILNANNQVVNNNTIGEICIGGSGVSKGYLNNLLLTQEKFIEIEYSNDKAKAIFYKTGDLGRLTKHNKIEYLGRIDNQVKVRGYRIELGEIENCITKYGNIKQVVTLVREDVIGDKRIVAYIELLQKVNDDNNKLYLKELKEFVAFTLPHFMVPNHFVILNSFELLPNGKINKQALPMPNSQGSKRLLVPPSNIIEQEVQNIWQTALNNNQIDITDNFFDLGGNSLIAIQVMIQIEKKLGYHLPLATLFEAPTIQQLCTLVSKTKEATIWKSLVAIKPQGDNPPLYIVHGTGLTVMVFNTLANNLANNQPVYGLQARGLNGTDEPYTNMQEIASYYVNEILFHNPNGPYMLAGYSFGGIVAFEICKQIKALGKEVKMLAMFDTYADNSDNFLSKEQRLFKKIKRQFPKALFFVKSFLNNPSTTLQYQQLVIKNKLKDILVAKGLLQKAVTDEEKHLYADKINAAHEKAYNAYRLTPYEGSIDLFKVNKRVYYLDDPITLGWKKIAGKGVNVHVVEGDHKTFMYSPYAEELAKKLQACINDRIKI